MLDLTDKQFWDLIVSAGILLFIIAPRFNTWTKQSEKLFSEKPKDFIDEYRFYTFCSLYLLTFVILLSIFRSHQFLNVFNFSSDNQSIKNFNEIFGENSLSVHLLIITTLLNNNKVNYWDERWRDQLHSWARIPRAVEEFRDSIDLREAFSPKEECIDSALRDLQRKADPSYTGDKLKDYWEFPFKQWEKEKEQRSIRWYYIKCLCLFVIARDNCINLSSSSMEDKRNRIHDLAKIIPFQEGNDHEVVSQKQELERFSKHYIECICKHIVKKYPIQENQIQTFVNLGFNISFHDTKKIRVLEDILYSIVGIIIVTGFTTALFLAIFDTERMNLKSSFDVTWVRWTTGASISFCISIFIGLLVQKISNSSQNEITGYKVYFLTFFLATLACITSMQLRGMEMSLIPQLALAISYSTLAVVTFLSLEEDSIEIQDVISNTIRYAVSLAIVFALLHVIITMSFAFSSGRVTRFGDLDIVILLKSAILGLIRGGLLAATVSYLIQSSIRHQKLAALRSTPRVKLNTIIFLEHNGNRVPVNAKDLSQSGIRVIGKTSLQVDETVTIDSNYFGKIPAIIRWTRTKFSNRHEAGIEFKSESSELNNFIRKKFGEFYALA